MKLSPGSGGHQAFHKRIYTALLAGPTVTFDDAQLGELIRHMSQYGSGGFQARLRKAFMRSLRELFGIHFEPSRRLA